MDLALTIAAMDDLPLDFTEYVSQRLGLTSDETKQLLSAWLRSYEPVTRQPIRTLARARARGEDEGQLLLRRAG